MGTRKRRRPYRHRNQSMDGNGIRVRGKRLDEIDNTKLALAYWLLAKQLVEDRTDARQLSEHDVRNVADQLDDEPSPENKEST